ASAGLWLVLAVVGLLALFLLKGTGRKGAEPQAESAFNAYPAPVVPASPLQSMQTILPPEALERNNGASLREVRQRSPMVIFNNTTTGAGVPPSAAEADASNVPMPSGFRPSKAAESRSTALGDRTLIIAQGKLIDAVLE